MTPQEFLAIQTKELESIKDWNKDWPNSNRMAPKKCVDCGRELEKPKPKYKILMPKSKAFPYGLTSSYVSQIRIDCSCGACYIWSFPNVYRKTHRTVELLMDKDINGNILVPMDVKL